jgi:hypothetical protein
VRYYPASHSVEVPPTVTRSGRRDDRIAIFVLVIVISVAFYNLLSRGNSGRHEPVAVPVTPRPMTLAARVRSRQTKEGVTQVGADVPEYDGVEPPVPGPGWPYTQVGNRSQSLSDLF